MKRLVSIVAAAGFLSLGSTAPSQAQAHYHGVHRSTVVVGGGFYGGFYPYYWASPFWYGYPWFPYASPYGPYPYYYPQVHDHSIRLEVTPKTAEVFADSYYAGIVDDFDGAFQRLHLPPGKHEITIYQDGYRTVHQSLYLSPDSSSKIKYAMVKLAPGETAEPRPTPPPAPANVEGPQGPQGPQWPRFPPPPQGGQPGPPTLAVEVGTSGTLVIRVQPENATVLIDGERWQGPTGSERLIVSVSEGLHRVQVQKDGYEPFSTDVTVRRGEGATLNVSLRTR